MRKILYTEPPKTAQELKKRMDKYFNSRVETQTDEKTQKKKKQIICPYTLTGFALALGLESREELYTFKDPKMQSLIRRGILRIEEYAEERLFSKDAFSGVKLFLSVNFDRWRDLKGGVEEHTDADLLDEQAKKWAQ